MFCVLVLVLYCFNIGSGGRTAQVLENMSSSDGDVSSEDSLLRALADAHAPPPPARRRGPWRKMKRRNKERPLRAAKKAVDSIGGNLGRGARVPREVPEGRRERRDAVKSDSMLSMALGDDARDDLPSAPVAAARAGFSKEMARRSRKIVHDCLQTSLDDRVASCFARVAGSDEPIGVKFQWDETALRMYLPLHILKCLFPFSFEEKEEEEEAEAEAADATARGQGSGSRPSYTVQIMQSQGSVMLGQHAGKLD